MCSPEILERERMRFGAKNRQETGRSWARRPPPNYLSRSVQGRLFLLVAALMIVLIAMQEARDPRYYRIFENLQKRGSTEEVDTRLRSPDTGTGGLASLPPLVRADRPQGQDEVASEQPWAAAEEAPGGAASGEQPLLAARRDGWAVVLGRLEPAQRDLLAETLKSARDGRVPAAEDGPRWAETLQGLDRSWQEYFDRARGSIEEGPQALTGSARETWRAALDDLQTGWVQLSQALAVLGTEQSPTAPQREDLSQLQAVLDEIFLEAIRDATVFRPEEADAWFRLWEKLQARGQAELESASTGPVTFLALYRQPDAYWGKLVTLSGAVRQGKRVSAPANVYGIEGYYMLWVKPHGARSPVVVYALELPEGFPLGDLPVDGAYVTADEDVSLTGYFFKRWAYRAQDSTRVAPLILVKTVRWEAAAEQGPAPATGLTAGRLTLLILGTLAFGVLVSVLVYWTTRGPSRPASGPPAAVPVEPAMRDEP